MIYLRSTEKLDGDVLNRFLKGQHVQHHQDGIWNWLWLDMMIESTFMRFGYRRGGIIGVTLNQPVVRCWALSLHICNRLMKDIAELKEETDTAVQSHKEEIPSRVKPDGRDQETICQKLKQRINPLDGGDELVNIVTGGIYSEKANALAIGIQQMKDFESGWPESSHQTISTQVVMMLATRKQAKNVLTGHLDTGLIFARAMTLTQSHDIDVKNLFEYELAPIPTAMFEEKDGLPVLKIAKSNSQ